MKATAKFLWAAVGATGPAKTRMLQQRKDAYAAFMASGARISFPKPSRPRATLVVPVYNHAYHTYACLTSLLPVAGPWLEILIGDDCSADQTPELLSRFDNITVVRGAKNQGFLRNVNGAVAKAKGRFIILMNNDARIISGSLEQALDRFEAEKNCGFMGPRIVLASGGLQEAGAVIFNNGGTNGYLRHQDVNDPRALFYRDVDYCSGVFSIFEKKAFEKLGCFDQIYAPAYYEETDLCMRMQKEGLRCVYNPELLIEHFEFGSAPSKNTRALIYRNRHIFLERWGETLRRDGHAKPKVFATEQDARRLQKHPRRLLVIDHAAVTPQEIEKYAAGAGTLTVFLRGARPHDLVQLAAGTGFAHELARGAGRAQLKAFLARRKGLFDELKTSGDKAAQLAAGLKL